jgi:hypothetical protein
MGMTADQAIECSVRLAEDYSVEMAVAAFRKHQVDIEFEVKALRALCVDTKGSNGAVRLKALEALQMLRREFITRPLAPAATTNPSKNGTPVAAGRSKDDWTGSE